MKKLANKPFWLWMWLCVVGLLVPIQLVADDYYLIGNFTNNWDLNSAIKLTPNGNQYEIKQSFNQDDEFKIVKNKDWNQGSWGYSNVNDKSLVYNKDGKGNATINATGCYGIFFKPSDGNTIYMTKSSDCPQPYSLWGFDFLYQEGGSGGTKKWASTKGSADPWDGNFIATSADGETFDLGVIKRKSKFIGFRFYTNSNGAEVNGANVIWRNTDSNVKAIEGSDYGKWSNDGTKASTVAGTDAVWHQTDRNNALLGYENGTYSFDLVFELKVNNQEKKEVRTIHITYTINEFELTTNLSGPCHVGDLVQLNISGGTAPYTWQSSNDGISWSTLSGASGTAYTHKVADKTFIRAKDSNGSITNVVELTPSIRCDQDHTITIFKETFGTLSDVDARASYSKNNVPVEGTNITYTASVPYTASTVSCGAMTDGGYYAVLANPRNAGCGTNIAQGTQNCNCVDEVDKVNTRWYRNTTDHTGDTNGGMLMYNCKDGTSTTDVLYECIINGLCDSTYINFSAFVTCANRGLHGNIPIEAEFKLFNAANNAEIDTYEVKNIGLSEEWKEISAMFNSGAATSVKIQLINKAGDGQGNDLLFDDMTLSICTPEANLVCSDGVSTESVIVAGGSETLTASVLSGVMNKPYYLWQYQVGRADWVSMGEPQRDHATITVTPESSPTKYRVILANSIHEAKAVADGSTGKACGVHAITNEATVYAAFVTMSAATSVGNICLDGEDPSQLTLTITNPSGIEINNLKVNVGIPINYINKVTVASGTGYSNNVWNVGTLANGASKTLKLNLKSDAATDEAVKEVDIKPYVSQLNNQTWANYDDSPTKSSAKLALNQVTKTPTAVTDYFECAKTGTLTLASLVNVENPANLVFYDGETSLTTVTSVSKSDTSIDKYYYFTYQEGTKCVSKRGKVHVKIIPVPTASITSGASQTKCAAEKYTFTISATAANGTGVWEVTSGSAEIDNKNSASTTACVLAGKTATLTWTVSNEKCDATASTTLSVDEQPKVTLLDGKGSASICGKSEFTVGVNTTASSGTWSIVEGSASIQSPNDKETLVTGVEAGKTVKLKYTATNGTCDPVDSELVVLTNLVCNQFVLDNKFANETIGKGICLNQETTLTVTITNSSMATSTNVKTSVKLPAGLTYVTHSGSGTYNKDTGLWLIPSLEKGEDKKAQLVITVKGTTAATHNVTATITEATGTPVSGMSIPASITVHALPTAAFDAASSTICIDEQDNELTNIKVNFTGAAPFELTYHDAAGNTYVENNLSASAVLLNQSLDGDESYTLKSVTDANGCTSAITGKTHQVTTQTHASLGVLTTPPAVCEGSVLALTAPAVTNNKGAVVTNPTWFLDGKAFDPATTVTNAQHNGKPLYYQITSSCNGNVRPISTTPAVNVTVHALPSVAFDATQSTICIDEQDKELTNIKVNFTGAAPFDITYQVDQNAAVIKKDVPNPYYIKETLTGNSTITLLSVVDNNGCDVTPTANQTHTVTTQTHASLGALTTPPAVCEGGVLTLTAPTVTNNKGAVVTNPTWFLDGKAFDPATTVTNALHNGKPLYYQITSSCNGKVRPISTTPAVNVTVHALPSVAFDATQSTICIDEQDKELTNIKVNFTGAAPFDITYQVDQNAAVIKNDVPNPYYIKETLTGNSTITLLSVVDNNGCDVTPTANQTHTVTTKTHASLGDLTTPPAVCEGGVLALTAPTVTNNKGAVVTNPTWFLDGKAFDPATTVTNALHNGKELYYQITSSCNGKVRPISTTPAVKVTVDAQPVAFAGTDQTQCNNSEFIMAATAPSVGTGLWTVVEGTADIDDTDAANTKVTGVPLKGSATLQWQITNGKCISNASTVKLTNNDCTELTIVGGTAPVVCDGNEATFTFTLTNGSGVKTTNVTSTITLGTGLSNAVITYNGQPLAGNTWVVPSMEPGDVAVLTIKANATTTGATATVKVDKASEVSVNNVQASITATVNALPSAAFDITSSTICIDEQDNELTNIKVNFTGAANFNLTYKVNNGAAINKTNLPSPYYIKEQLSDDATIMLVSVTDANGCTGTITNQSHTVTTQTHASLGALTAPEGVCNGGVLTLTAPDVTNNKGAVVTNPTWFLDGKAFDPTTSVTHDEHNGKPLYYQITSSCNGNVRDIATTPAVNVTVYATPQLSVAYTDPKGNEVTATQISCAIPYLTATLSGAETYTWTDGSTQNPRVLGQKGQTTTYQVTGVTTQNCTSEPLTITVTEDFATPDVAIAASDKTITCSVTEITLTASSNTAGVTYKWDDADETAGAIVKVATPNTYKVTATNSTNGCSAIATETIGINTEKPVIVITSKDANGTATSTLNCTAEASTLTLTPSVTNVNSIGGPVTFVWDGDNTIPTERTVNEAKRYTVAATGANGCSASQFIDITLDDDVPTLTLTASAADITCLVQSSVLTAQATPSAGVTYAWNTNESGSQITVNAGGTYEVVATAVNGCTVTKSVTIDQHTDLPNVTISSTDPKQYCRVNTLTASGADKYVWSTNQTTTSIEVSEGGEYWVEGTNAYGCSARAELNLENDKEAPVVAISSDINAITCTNSTATLTATVTNADDARTYSYQWSPKSGTNSTLRVTEGKTYKVVVTDGTNYCKGEKTIAVAQHTEKPMVDLQTLPAVCLPATIDLSQAIGPNTLADNVVFFEDEALTKEITNTTIDLAQYNVFYVQGQQVNGNGCMGDAQPVAANVKAVTPAPVVKDYDECTKAGSEKFSSLVTSGYYKLNFYASENDETPIADAFDASASNTTTTYYVSNTNQGACESERVPFTVHIEGLVDFELEVSETNVLAGGNQVVVTLTPASVEVDQYKWMANGNVLPVEGEEYSANLYIDTKFEVAAKGRCNTLVKEAFVEVVWPTAFTPYNNNNLNETFAKGLPVQIFNRFGVLVFEGPDGWDGVMNKNMGANNMAVPGVYYYAVPLPAGNVKKGTIEIVKF